MHVQRIPLQAALDSITFKRNRICLFSCHLDTSHQKDQPSKRDNYWWGITFEPFDYKPKLELVAPVMILDFLIKLFLQFWMLSKVFIYCHCHNSLLLSKSPPSQHINWSDRQPCTTKQTFQTCKTYLLFPNSRQISFALSYFFSRYLLLFSYFYHL